MDSEKIMNNSILGLCKLIKGPEKKEAIAALGVPDDPSFKIFKDLEFTRHPAMSGKMSRINFPNGYGVSVVRFGMPLGGGYGSYTNDETEWEVAVLHHNGICYATPITGDVLGHRTDSEVSDIMRLVQALPTKKQCSHERKFE